MATLYGVNRTIFNDAKQSSIVDGALKTRNMGFMYDEYEASAASIGDTIQVCDKLPIGAILVGAVIRCDALGASSTLQLGDAGDDDRYIPAASTASATTLNFQSGTVGHIDNGFGYVVTGTSDTQLALKVAGASITGTIKVFITYAYRG